MLCDGVNAAAAAHDNKLNISYTALCGSSLWTKIIMIETKTLTFLKLVFETCFCFETRILQKKDMKQMYIWEAKYGISNQRVFPPL